MAFWDAWFSRRRDEAKAITSADLFLSLLASAAAKSGVRVTAETILQASAALGCARVIAEGLAQVPVKLHRARSDGGSDVASDHPAHEIVSSAVNAWTTSFEWRETAGLHLAIGNRAYAIINRVGNARTAALELLPLDPATVRVESGGGAPRYFVRTGETEIEVAAERMLHLRGPSWNGYEGLDGVRLAREAVGLSLAAEEHGARMFSNGAITGGILTTEQTLTKEQRDALRESWAQAQEGLRNAYKTVVLGNGMKWVPRAQQNDQAQWIEVRRFQVEEVCRFYRVQPIMVGYSDKATTYASAEQMFLAHAVHTMGPWYRRIEERLNLQLLTAAERAEGLGFKFHVQALLRGAHRDRAEFYRVMHSLGAMNANEIRALEDMNPYPDGNEYLVPLNMAPAGSPPDAGSGQTGNP